MIEIMRFRLAAGADEAGFLAADRRLQTGFAYHQAGLLRRTTARNDAGEWIVIDLWRSEADADACAERWEHHRLPAEFLAFVDRATIRVERFRTLD